MPGDAMSAEEACLTRTWKLIDDLAAQNISIPLERRKSKIAWLLTTQNQRRGHNPVLSEAQADSSHEGLKEMITAAKAAAAMFKRSMPCKTSIAAVWSRVHVSGIFLYKMRAKPMLMK